MADAALQFSEASFHNALDADIDFEVARSYVNAGLIDRAEPLFLRARDEGEPTAAGARFTIRLPAP